MKIKMVNKEQLIKQLNSELKSYQKSYRLSYVLKGGIWFVQGTVACSVSLISIPMVAIIPAAVIGLISAPSVALLLSPLHKLPKKDKLKANIIFYSYLIQRIKEGISLEAANEALEQWMKNPIYCKPYRVFRMSRPWHTGTYKVTKAETSL